MSPIKDLFDGVRYFFRGFSFLLSKPRLWPWALIPFLINLALILVMIWVFVHYYGDLYGWLVSYVGDLTIDNPSTWYWQALNALLWVVNVLFQLLLVLVALILLLIVGYAAGLIIAAPFNDALSERVEIIVTGKEGPPFVWKKFLGDMLRIIRVESVKAAILIVIPIALLVLNLIPGVGGVIYVVLTLIFGAWDLGFAFADLPLGRRIVPTGDRFRFGWRHKWSLVGLGAGFVIPFFSLLFAPILVVGGTLLTIDRRGST